MAKPTLTPASTTSVSRLPVTGSTDNVAANLAFGIYSRTEFLQGAKDQVAYVYKKLGGDILDIELTEGQVYAAYEESVLEYSYIINVHQSKNALSTLLGSKTGSFNSDGQFIGADALSGSDAGKISLKYPSVQFSYAKKIGQGISNEIGLNGYDTVYSASFDTVVNKQDYDLQGILTNSASLDPAPAYAGKIGNNRIEIKRVYYKTPHAMWRFYGYYGGLNTVGNLQTYGQWADDSQFQIVPVWHNKLQAKSFESAIYTRMSHFSYELKNNRLRIFPMTQTVSPTTMWLEFTIPNEKQPWEEDDNRVDNIIGVNNMNTLPFENIPYIKINSIGKQWIRRFALALCKEILGQVRSKFATIPIPGESVTLNGPALMAQSKEEQAALREELKTILDEMTYTKLLEQDASNVESTLKVQERMPLPILVG